MKECKIIGCERNHHAKGYCGTHIRQIRKYGKIMNLGRTKFTPNEFVIDKNICRIKLYNAFGIEKAETIIDVEDYGKVKDMKWCLLSSGYVRHSTSSLRLHQLILGVKGGDHRNRNPLDNRKSNLRRCTRSQNMQNSKTSISNKSGYKGVSWAKHANKWISLIYKNRKAVYLGIYNNKEEAAEKYNKAAIKYFGEFVCLNLIGPMQLAAFPVVKEGL